MDTLRIQNVNSYFWSSNKDLMDLLHDSLRFRDPNCFYNAAYQRKKWDGYKDFFNDKNGHFLTGLVPEVMYILEKRGHQYKIIDQRNANIQWQHQNIDEHFLDQWRPADEPPITLYDYQPDLVNVAMRNLRGLVQAPTSAGKTYIMISLIKALPPKTPVLFLTKSSQLVDQNYRDMLKWGIPNVGRWYGKYKEPNYVMCCTLHHDTLESIKGLLPKFKVLIVDEVHECVSAVAVDAYRQMHSACVRIGVSATPFRLKNSRSEQDIHKFTVKSHFGPILKTKTTATGLLNTKDLQDRDILSKSQCTFYYIDHPDISYEPWQDAVTLGIAENYYFHDVIKRLANSLTGRTLTMVERIIQGMYLSQLLPKAHWISGKDDLDVRQPVIDALKSGPSTTAIVMRHIITAGINLKIHNLINASGGNAAHNVKQQIGRGLRKADDKDILHYYDFIFRNSDYLEEHSWQRVRVLEKEGHEIILKEIDF